MKRSLLLMAGIIFATSLFSVMPASAQKKDNILGNYLYKRKAIKAIKSYTDNTVLKTIERLVTNIETLDGAANRFRQNKNDVDLAATFKAWHEVLASVNRSAIFLYGPAAQYDYNKQIALNPFDKILVDHALGEMKAGKLRLDSQALRNETASMRGLFTVRYLLYRNGQPRKVADFKKHELDYLVAATGAMVEEGVAFQSSWLGTDNMSASRKAILKKNKMKYHTSYAWEFKNPGKEQSRYLCVSVPLQELIQEAASVLEEMVPAIEKLSERDESELKYWDSLNPYAELIDLLKGVENAYLGGVEGSRGTSFSQLVAEKDTVLDDRIKTAIAHTAKRLEVLQDMKNASAEHREKAIKVAASECKKLASRIMVATPLVTADPAVEPFGPYGSDL